VQPPSAAVPEIAVVAQEVEDLMTEPDHDEQDQQAGDYAFVEGVGAER